MKKDPFSKKELKKLTRKIGRESKPNKYGRVSEDPNCKKKDRKKKD